MTKCFCDFVINLLYANENIQIFFLTVMSGAHKLIDMTFWASIIGDGAQKTKMVI